MDAKFGAFIHFGVYSSLEGEYQERGSQHRYSEWIQVSGKITANEYHDVAANFNPAEFDANEWVKVFKDAGFRYVVMGRLFGEATVCGTVWTVWGQPQS